MFDYGPERNLEAWTEAMHMLDAFAEMAANLDNDALRVALVDCHERAKEVAYRVVNDPASATQTHFAAYDDHVDKAAAALRRSNEMIRWDYAAIEGA
jgi:hypothetical protein